MHRKLKFHIAFCLGQGHFSVYIIFFVLLHIIKQLLKTKACTWRNCTCSWFFDINFPKSISPRFKIRGCHGWNFGTWRKQTYIAFMLFSKELLPFEKLHSYYFHRCYIYSGLQIMWWVLASKMSSTGETSAHQSSPNKEKFLKTSVDIIPMVYIMFFHLHNMFFYVM